MEDYPLTQQEFEHRFASEEACREYLFQVRWPDGFRCPACQDEKYWLTGRLLYHCSNCNHETSLTSGTIFESTRKPLHLWFRAMWYVIGQKNGVSALGLQRILGVSRYETVWIWLHKLRAAMVRPGRERLSGTVEVDETYVGGKRGRGAEGKSLVWIAVEDKGDEYGRIRLRRISDASAESLITAIKETIEPESAIRTDAWKGYDPLKSENYKRIIENQSASVGDDLLPLVHRIASLLKRWLAGTHQGAVRPSHLDYYLDEFTFRFNRRKSRSRGKLFYRLIQQAVASGPVTAREIYEVRPQHLGGT